MLSCQPPRPPRTPSLAPQVAGAAGGTGQGSRPTHRASSGRLRGRGPAVGAREARPAGGGPRAGGPTPGLARGGASRGRLGGTHAAAAGAPAQAARSTAGALLFTLRCWRALLCGLWRGAQQPGCAWCQAQAVLRPRKRIAGHLCAIHARSATCGPPLHPHGLAWRSRAGLALWPLLTACHPAASQHRLPSLPPAASQHRSPWLHPAASQRHLQVAVALSAAPHHCYPRSTRTSSRRA